MIDGTKIKANLQRMEVERSSHETLWAEIAWTVFPRQSVYFGKGLDPADWTKLQANAAMMHSPYAAQAMEDGVSAFENFVMPRGERWQKLELPDESLMRKVSNQQWLETVERRLFAVRNDPKSGFANATHESASSLFAFGLQSIWVEPRWDWRARDYVGLSYQSEFIGDLWFECDDEGYPMRTYRRIVLTTEQALIRFGDEAPESVRKAASEPNPHMDKKFVFLHIIEPNIAVQAERLDAAGMPWSSCYYSAEDDVCFKHGGYRSMRRIVSRFALSPQQVYGFSPTMLCLPEIRQLQQMTLDRAAAAELRLVPPILTVGDDLDGAVLEYRAWGVTRGGLDDRGNPVFREMLTNADATDAEKLTLESRAAIDKAYYRDLLQLNREMKSHVSATRVAEEIAEKGLLLAPLARQENEWLSRQTETELALMADLGQLDDMPGEIAEYFASEGGIAIRYDNNLSHMQEAGKSAAFLNVAQQVGALAQFDPKYVDDFRREFPSHRVLPELGRIAGVPASMKATDEDKADYDEAKQQEAQLQALLQAAPALSGAAKDIAAAGQGAGLAG